MEKGDGTKDIYYIDMYYYKERILWLRLSEVEVIFYDYNRGKGQILNLFDTIERTWLPADLEDISVHYGVPIPDGFKKLLWHYTKTKMRVKKERKHMKIHQCIRSDCLSCRKRETAEIAVAIADIDLTEAFDKLARSRIHLLSKEAP